jgi:hypothetical protein
MPPLNEDQPAPESESFDLSSLGIDADTDVSFGDEDEDQSEFEVPEHLLDESERTSAAPADATTSDPAKAPADGAHSEPAKTAHPPATDAKPGEPVADAAVDAPADTDGEFEFKVDGETLFIPGSKRVEIDGRKGVFLPEAQLREVTRTLSEGVHHRTTFKEKLRTSRDREQAALRQVDEVRAAVNEDVVRAQEFLRDIRALREKGPDAIAAWLDDLEREWPLLEARAERAITTALQAKPATTAGAAAASAEGERSAPREVDTAVVQQNLAEAIDELCDEHDAFRGFTPEQRKHLAKLMERTPGAYFHFATAYDDEHEIEPGDLVVQLQPIADVMEHHLFWLKETAATAEQLASAEAKNRAKGLVPSAPPAAVPAKEGQHPEGARAIRGRMPTTKAELEAYQKLPLEEQIAIAEGRD